MKRFLISLALLRGFLGAYFATATTEASAATCARGVYRAGCAGPRGAVVARRPVAPPRTVCARGVYRAGCVVR
jgi:hypothetical protein